jgi:hypothetical protein
MGLNKCPECLDDIKLFNDNVEVYWVHTGDKDPDCFLRNVAE